MKIFKLIAFGSLMSFALSVPAQGQTSPAQPSDLNNSEPAQTEAGTSEVSSEFSEPLQVGQEQADQFFAPPQRQQVVESQTVPAFDSDDLINPPPGSQTSDEITPGQQLSIPIR